MIGCWDDNLKFSPPKPSANFNEKFLPSMQWDFAKRNVRHVNRIVGWARTFFVRSLQVRVFFFKSVSSYCSTNVPSGLAEKNMFLGKSFAGCCRPFFPRGRKMFSCKSITRGFKTDHCWLMQWPSGPIGPAWWDQVVFFDQFHQESMVVCYFFWGS